LDGTSFDLAREGHGFIDARQRALRARRLRLKLRSGKQIGVCDAKSADKNEIVSMITGLSA
jgi:hypothetical protein